MDAETDMDAASAVAATRPSQHILIVDDCHLDLRLLEMVLEQNNYRLSLAEDGSMALQLALDETPDLILLDVQMPEMDGYEVCQMLKRHAPLQDVPVIFLSAHEESGDKIKAFECGGVDYVTKPFRLDELKARIKTHLSLRDYQQRLELSNQHLKQTLADLNAAQTQLIQTEKMASLGTLAAGVAHEINNPVGYISSNLNSLKGYIDGLFDLVATYEETERYVTPPEKLTPVLQKKKTVDLQFLREDMQDLLRESEEGVSRVRKIVKDLKDFSHVDKVELVLCDLHAGIESTLNVAWNEIKYKAEVIREFSELPPVCCVPSQINQVTMNLLVNAAHAIKEQGKIWIRTGVEQHPDQEPKNVYIEIEDNGCGIAPEHIEHLFEPFFTTKPVGKGTGLGLSLANGIVQQHQGSIQVWSEPGHGSRFRVTLPIQPETECEACATV